MFEWTPERIAFYRDACDFSGYPEQLADRIARKLAGARTVCDAGCGLGYLTLALAARVPHVTAVDRSAAALCVLQDRMRALGASNIDVREGDIEALPPSTPYDAMVFCFFGGIDDTLRILRAQGSGRAVLVKKDFGGHRFGASGAARAGFTLADTRRALDARSIPYACETFPLDMGQPFRTLGDARTFSRLYDGDPEAVLARLVRIERPPFSWYWPAVRPVGLVTLGAYDTAPQAPHP